MHLRYLATKNPVWIASSHLTENIENIEKCCKAGAGAIVLKGADGRISQPCDRNCKNCGFPLSFNGRRLFLNKKTIYSFTPNTLTCEFLSLEEIKIFLSFLKRNYQKVVRIANISAKNTSSFLKIARTVEKYGVEAIELGAKYTIRHKDSGASNGKKYILDFLRKIYKKIKAPLIVKVCPDLLDEKFLKEISKYVDGLTIADGRQGLLPYNFRKKLPPGVKKKTCSVVGEPVWKLVKKYVPIAKKYVGFVSASGGIINSKRAKEIMKLGADSVQLCSGIEFSGCGFIKQVKGALNS